MILIGRGLNLGKKRGSEERSGDGSESDRGSKARSESGSKGSEEKKLVLRDSRLCSCEGV